MPSPVFLAILAAAPGVLTLNDAVKIGATNQPQIRQLHAQTAVAEARTDEAFAPLLPQVVATGRYGRLTQNGSGQATSSTGATGATTTTTIPAQSGNARSQFDTFNSFSFGVTASQLVYDFGQTTGQYKATRASGEAAVANEQAQKIIVEGGVRSAFFAARAQKELVVVAKRTLANQEKHLKQIEGFVEVKTRPAIDLYQAKTDVANAHFQVISSEGNYAIAKASLNQAMGVEWPTSYEVADDNVPPVDGETGPADPLIDQALKSRPEFISIEKQIEAAQLTERSVKGSYGPSISVSTSITDAGSDITNLAWNWNAFATATWPIFTGLSTPARVREAKANIQVAVAQRDALRQQVRVAIESARLSIQSAVAQQEAADEALTNAEELLKLAEGRYAAGVGTIIELGDAQLAETQASAQKVQAEYTLATARAQLLQALGRQN